MFETVETSGAVIGGATLVPPTMDYPSSPNDLSNCMSSACLACPVSSLGLYTLLFVAFRAFQ